MKLRYKILIGLFIFLGIAMSSLALVMSNDEACGPAPALSSDVETMQAIVQRCYGGPDILSLEVIEKPVPADNEVLVKVVAAAVNPLDWHFMRGTPYLIRLFAGLGTPDDTRVGVDFAGTVEAVGSNVTRFKPGDDVFGGGRGAFAEFIVVPEDGALASHPANVSPEQAAALPVAAITALQALRDAGKLEPGQKVLINGASGGVGTFAVQIAKSFGAEVTGVCSTRNVEMVRSIGADHVFDYKKEDYTQSRQQYDLIIDMVSNHSLSKNRGVLKPGGRLVIVGERTGNWIGPLITPIKAMILSLFVDQEFITISANENHDDLVVLADLMQAGKVTSVIDSRYPLSEIQAAIRHSEDGHTRGKIIIEIR